MLQSMGLQRVGHNRVTALRELFRECGQEGPLQRGDV